MIVQRCRGTFGSGGQFDPVRHEQEDGLATIAWIKQQPNYGGAIGTYGPSYMGFVQWAVARDADDSVKAMSMQVTLATYPRMPYAGNSFMLENSLSWSNMVSKQENILWASISLIATLLGINMIKKPAWKTLPLDAIDRKVIGRRVHFWQDWLRYPNADDPWWAPVAFENTIAAIDRPITMVAGWYDIFTPWQMRDFAELQKAGCDVRITIGPWRHIDFGQVREGLIDTLDWFDRYLRGVNLAATRKAVRLYLIKAESWLEFDTWPPQECASQCWYLQPNFSLGKNPATASEPDTFRYDPGNPTPSVGGPALVARPYSVNNARLERRGDVLSYTSEALVSDLDVIGVISARIFVAADRPMVDIFVRLNDVDPSGRSFNVCDGLQRLRIGAGGAPQCIFIELWPTAYRFAAGHRLRVQVSGGAFPRWVRSAGSDESLGSATTLYPTNVGIHRDDKHHSTIILPVYGKLRD